MSDLRHSRESGNLGNQETSNEDFLGVAIQKLNSLKLTDHNTLFDWSGFSGKGVKNVGYG
jgi:hypothetical protein